MGSDSLINFIRILPFFKVRNLDLIDNFINRVNEKMATGELILFLKSQDYKNLLNFLLLNPNSPSTQQLIERIKQTISNNNPLISIEDKNINIINASSILDTNISLNPMQTVMELKEYYRFVLGVNDVKGIEVDYSLNENCFVITFKPTGTKL